MILKVVGYVLLALTPFYLWLFIMRVKYPLNPYKCVLKYGKPGTGKTVDIVYNCLKDLREGWNVYTNIDVNIDGVRKFDARNFGEYKFEPHSRVYIDEVGIIWNNRDFKSFDIKKREFTKLYRHNQISIIMYSQSNDVDITLRRITSEEWIMKKVLYWTVERKLKKNLKILPPEECQNADEQLVNYLEKESIFTPGAFHIYYQPTYYGYTDTYDLPPYPDYPYKEMIGKIRHRSTRRILNKRKKRAERTALRNATKKSEFRNKRPKLFNRREHLQNTAAESK